MTVTATLCPYTLPFRSAACSVREPAGPGDGPHGAAADSRGDDRQDHGLHACEAGLAGDPGSGPGRHGSASFDQASFDQASFDQASFDQASFDQTSRSEEHTSELQSLMSISYAILC